MLIVIATGRCQAGFDPDVNHRPATGAAGLRPADLRSSASGLQLERSEGQQATADDQDAMDAKKAEMKAAKEASRKAAGSFGAYCRCMMVTYPFKDGYRELYGRAGDGEGGGEGGGGQIDLTEWDVCSVSRRLACWLQGQHQRLRAFASHVMERQCCEHLG